MTLIEVVQRFNGAKRRNTNSFQCRCSAHNDRNASLTITEKDGRILLYCHAGCKFDDIIRNARLERKDLYI